MTTLAERFNLALHAKAARETAASQADLARYCGVATPSVSNWFTGATTSLKAHTLLLAADYLGVRPKWLLDGTGPMLASQIPAHQPTPPSLHDAIGVMAVAMRAMPPAARAALSANLAGWAESGGGEPWGGLVLALLSQPASRKLA
jgi:hypothetical protein